MLGNAWSRDAEEFDSLVSGRVGAPGDAHADLLGLLELVAAMRDVPPVTARPEFVSSLRSQLVAEAERMPAKAQVDRADHADHADLAARLTPSQRRGSRERRVAALIGGFAVVAASGSMAVASQDALPGDVLYPIKRAIENAQTNLKSDGASKADSLIAHARARLVEVEDLTAQDASGEEVAQTLQDFSDQAQRAADYALDDYTTTGNTESVEDLRDFAGDSMATLSSLADVVPDDARASLITATQTIRQIDAAAWEACPTCAGGDVAELPDFATLSLAAVLEAAPVPAPGPTPVEGKPDATEPASPQAPVPSAAPTGPASVTEPDLAVPPAPPVPSPSTIGGKVGKTLKGVTGGLVGGLGLAPTEPAEGSADDTVLGTLVGGLTGLVGGLLGTTPTQ